MIRVLIPVLILAVAVVVIAARSGGGLVRGMAGDMLVSPARPAVGVLPRPFSIWSRRAGSKALRRRPTGRSPPLPGRISGTRCTMPKRPKPPGRPALWRCSA